ncbi:MAG: histidine--tRNA ligase [Aquificota bacterium]|nr:MAG: histidine--tRNA ligase [Aquificota bacterium]
MIKAVKGFRYILPQEIPLWRRVEEEARNLFEAFGYSELRIPILEKTELFKRSLGDTSDIVEKEMYTFQDKGGDSVTMRPEATASMARAYLEHALYHSDPVGKYFFFGPMFRHERPQAGRLRQFHQLDVEAFGYLSPSLDAEVICLLDTLYRRLNIRDLTTLEINSLGCRECRPRFREALLEFLDGVKDALCPDCQRRRERNPLRVLDCKEESCQEVLQDAPDISRHLCQDCQEYHGQTLAYLDSLGVEYTINPRLVRGLDYYTRTVFELTTTHLGAQNAVAAGGRYDDLLKQIGGKDIPSIGFAVGVERTVMLLEKRRDLPQGTPFHCYLALLGRKATKEGFNLAQKLREKGIRLEMNHQPKSLKAQLRRADKIKVPLVIILGEEELAKGTLIVRNMAKGEQEERPLEDLEGLVGYIKKEVES